jgi:hypothetical protein
MIPSGTLDTPAPALPDHELALPDPAALHLVHELRDAHKRLELFVARVDPRTVPQGVADGLHDAMVALSDAAELAHVHAWGVGAL